MGSIGQQTRSRRNCHFSSHLTSAFPTRLPPPARSAQPISRSPVGDLAKPRKAPLGRPKRARIAACSGVARWPPTSRLPPWRRARARRFEGQSGRGTHASVETGRLVMWSGVGGDWRSWCTPVATPIPEQVVVEQMGSDSPCRLSSFGWFFRCAFSCVLMCRSEGRKFYSQHYYRPNRDVPVRSSMPRPAPPRDRGAPQESFFL
jgi:hypothetical protein